MFLSKYSSPNEDSKLAPVFLDFDPSSPDLSYHTLCFFKLEYNLFTFFHEQAQEIWT